MTKITSCSENMLCLKRRKIEVSVSTYKLTTSHNLVHVYIYPIYLYPLENVH